MNPTTVGELKAKLSEYADDELVLVDGMSSDRDIASVEYDAAVEGYDKGYLVICGTSEGMN
jgi:hypothetical protein